MNHAAAGLPMNTLATEFIALLGDAKPAAIQSSMSAMFVEEFTETLAAA